MKDVIICKSCGTVNDYRTEKKSNNLVAYCKSCGAYIKNIPYAEPALYFGKYKNTKIKDMTTPQQVNYLHWLKQSEVWFKLSNNIRQAIDKHLG